MNAKKICALALSLGLSASFAPKSDAGLIGDAFKATGVYAGYRAANIWIPKHAKDYSGWWNFTVEKGGDFIMYVKSYIDKGVDFSIKFAEQKFELEKKFEINNLKKKFEIKNLEINNEIVFDINDNDIKNNNNNDDEEDN